MEILRIQLPNAESVKKSTSLRFIFELHMEYYNKLINFIFPTIRDIFTNINTAVAVLIYASVNIVYNNVFFHI